jgi:hypothetical protein
MCNLYNISKGTESNHILELGEILFLMPWRRDVEVIISANEKEDRGFESRPGVIVFRTLSNTLQCCSLYIT